MPHASFLYASRPYKSILESRLQLVAAENRATIAASACQDSSQKVHACGTGTAERSCPFVLVACYSTVPENF